MDGDEVEAVAARILGSPFLSSRPFYTAEPGTLPQRIYNQHNIPIASMRMDAMADDAALIVAAVNALPALLAEVARLQAEAKEATRLRLALAHMVEAWERIEGIVITTDQSEYRVHGLEEMQSAAGEATNALRALDAGASPS